MSCEDVDPDDLKDESSHRKYKDKILRCAQWACLCMGLSLLAWTESDVCHWIGGMLLMGIVVIGAWREVI